MSKDKKNQFRSRIIKYLTSTPFIAVILGSLITYFLPHIFDRYKIDLIKREKVASNKRIFYNDFDKNGQSEKIEIISPWNGKTAVIVYTGGKVLGQYNFDGEFVNIKPVFCADIDNDQLDEVFIFTWQNNHIRLNCFNPVSKKTLFANKFISEYHKINNTVDVGIYPCGFYDVNADGWKEFYFSIVSGFSASLRNMFALNIANDTLYVSPDDCLNTIDPFAIDLDKDGTLEFCGSTQATGNCDSTNSISDFNSWLTVFNPRLKYKFKPLKIGFNPSTLKVCALRSTKQNYLVALNLYSGNKKFPCSIGIYNSKGKRIRQKLFEFSEEWQNACLISNENNKNKTFFIIKQNGQIEEWNSQLSIIAEQKIAPVSNTNYYETDIDKGLKKVRAFLLKDGDRLLLTDKRFKSPLTIDFSGNSCLHYMAAPGPWLKGTELFISGDSFHYYYDYYENPLYFFKYLIYAAVYILVFLLLLLIQKAQKYRDEQKYKAEKKIAELQIKSITNQLDPHFTLNILNSIGALFQKQDRNKVDYIFGKFSKLLRETVMDSDKIETTLENELEYIRNYLELQSFRLSYSFKYEINLNGFNAQNLKIPKTLVHTFVENAIKHGLRHLKKEGRLRIDVVEEKRKCIIKIDDNGVGREKAKTLSKFSTGKGLKILDQILDLYHKLENVKITYSIKDKYDELKNPAGTEIWITIPYNKDVFHESSKLHFN